jgi:hypothetical protein
MFTKSNEAKQEDGSVVIHNCYFPLTIPSYDRNVNVLLYPNKSPNHIFLEMSLPKMLFKTNIISPTRTQYIDMVEKLRCALVGKLGELPETKNWIVQRIDIAVQWLYKDIFTAKSVLGVLKQFGDTNFDTTTYKHYTTKFYLKQPEYLKHDYKWLKSVDQGFADSLAELSSGILRFEVSLKGKSVYTSFYSWSWDNIINADDILFKSLLVKRLFGFYNYLEPVMMTQEEAFEILAEKYNREMAIKLVGYIRIRDGNNPDKKKTLSVFDRQTRYRWNKLLREAKIGVSAETQVKMPKLEGIIVWRSPTTDLGGEAKLYCQIDNKNFAL